MKKYSSWVSVALLISVAAITYLPLVAKFGYSYDDWYLMPSARAEGPNVFWKIFSVDRPYRALVMIPAYHLFGANPLFYNLSAFAFRVAGALALFWILKILWPQRQSAVTGMALLFLIYPGFLSQPNAIDYQSHIVGLAAALFSIALTLKAVSSESRVKKIFFHALSLPAGWLYLGQMEWYIGFEFFRWACIFLLASRSGGTFMQKMSHTIQEAYPSIAVPGVFLIWRIFFFQSERGATDVGLQLSQLQLYPLQILYRWMVQMAQDSLDVTLSAWVIPLSQLTGYIQRWGGLLAILTAVLTVFVLDRLGNNDEIQSETQAFPLQHETLLLGLFIIVTGLLPIAMANRDVWFPSFSRYSLVSSTGVAIFLISVLLHLNSKALQYGAVGLLCLISVLTHHANAVKYASENSALKNFWWQVAWRVPQFEKNTTLVTAYPAEPTEEDYFIWGPASLIYYPTKQNNKNIQPGLFAAVANHATTLKVLTRQRQEYDNRKNIITYKNYRNIVLLSQPFPSACVHIIDGRQPENSSYDSDSIKVMSPYSEMEHVLADEAPHIPPEIVFGPEPAHTWCFYYQKADLARQKGDWANVLAIGSEAFEKGLAPADRVEWMPFLQAYAHVGNAEKLTELAASVGATTDPYIASQACRILSSMPDLSVDVTKAVSSLYCVQ